MADAGYAAPDMRQSDDNARREPSYLEIQDAPYLEPQQTPYSDTTDSPYLEPTEPKKKPLGDTTYLQTAETPYATGSEGLRTSDIRLQPGSQTNAIQNTPTNTYNVVDDTYDVISSTQQTSREPGPPPVYTSQPQGYGYPNVMTHQQQATTTVVMQQPPVKKYREWNSGVGACCDDMGICVMGTFCGLCLGCQLASDMNESSCVPCCVPGWLIALRVKMRTQEHIPGSLMDDCCMTTLCGACVLCQLSREVRYIKLTSGGVFTN